MQTQNTASNLGTMGKIEYIIMDPILTKIETLKGCQAAARRKPAGVWVKPCYVQAVVALLRSADIPVGTMISCSDGSTHTQIKVAEAKRALTEGALRLAAPINLGFAKEAGTQDLLADLQAMSGIAHMNGATFEVILKPDLLTTNELREAARAAERADVDVISFPADGLGNGGHTDLAALLRETLSSFVALKGLFQQVNIFDLSEHFNQGLDRVGVQQIND